MTVAVGRRSGLAVLVVSAFVGTLLAVSAGLAAGIGDKKVTYPARYSACVGDATADAGFSDTVGGIAEVAADCLAYYGIAWGTSPGVFSPDDNVTRVQMALFLARAAGPAGIVLPQPRDQGFSDLTGLPVDFRDAIDRMAELGIMEGRTKWMFAPDDRVTREDMAVHLAAFLAAAEVGPGGYDIDEITPDDEVFTDIEDLPHFANDAVREIYEMGVTRGTTATTFSPEALVTRAQMAAFITRMLAHTNARPAGPSIQLDLRRAFTGGSVEVAVSMRSTAFRPLSDSYVDVFTAAERGGAFDKDGRCKRGVTRREGAAACVIDEGDQLTDRLGNLSYDEFPSGKPMVIWAWTGGIGEVYDDDRTEAAVIDLGLVEGGAFIEVTDDMAANARLLGFGDPVTFTFQLVDRKGVPVPHAGVELRIYTALTDRTGRRTSAFRDVESDEAGRVRVTYSRDDPSSRSGQTETLDIDARARMPFDDKTTLGVIAGDSITPDPLVIWSDEKARATTLTLSQDQRYHEASADGDGVQNTVRATLVDQYGDPVVREPISFSSDDPKGVPNLKTIYTNSQGVASLSYLRDSAEAGVERIRANTVNNRVGNLIDIRHYWAKQPAPDAAGAGKVLVTDTAANTIIVRGSSTIWFLAYSTTDHFFLIKQSKEDSTRRSSRRPMFFDDFEATVEDGDFLAFDIAAPANTVDTITLTEIVSKPDAPAAPTVSVTSDQINISWTRPRSDGGDAITHYKVRWRCDSDDWNETAELPINSLPFGLKYSVAISCVHAAAAVQAKNTLVGWGVWSDTGLGSA